MLTFSFHFSLFNNLSVVSRKNPSWLNLYPKYIIKIIIKILGNFWGVTGTVAYQLALPLSLSGVHEVFRVSMLQKYTPDLAHVVD